MPAFTLTHVSDATLLADLAALVATDRGTTAALIAHIAEVEVRKLYAPAACSSMHAYCTRVLHLSEDAANKRIRAARAARRHPQLFDAIADGRLHLSGVGLLASHITDENVDELIAAATHRTKAEIELLVARLAPRPDLREKLEPVAPAPEVAPLLGLAPGPVAEQPTVPPPRLKPLAPERFGLQVTISQETRDKLERARALLRHRNPSGDLAEVIDRALDALLIKLEKEKFGATSRPRAKRARQENADPSHVTNDVRREVHARDDEQCAFVSASGERCTERGFLEFDHVTMRCRGGESSVAQVRLLCQAHNQYEAERILGADFMRAKRTAAKVARADHAVTVPDAELTTPSRIEPNAAPAAPVSFEQNGAPTTPTADDARVDAARSAAIDATVTKALRTMGFKATETQRAMANTAQVAAKTIEERLRIALAELTRSRCGDGVFEWGHVPQQSTMLICG